MDAESKRQISEALSDAKNAYMRALRIAENAGARKDLIRKIEVLTGRAEGLQNSRLLNWL